MSNLNAAFLTGLLSSLVKKREQGLQGQMAIGQQAQNEIVRNKERANNNALSILSMQQRAKGEEREAAATEKWRQEKLEDEDVRLGLRKEFQKTYRENQAERTGISKEKLGVFKDREARIAAAPKKVVKSDEEKEDERRELERERAMRAARIAASELINRYPDRYPGKTLEDVVREEYRKRLPKDYPVVPGAEGNESGEYLPVVGGRPGSGGTDEKQRGGAGGEDEAEKPFRPSVPSMGGGDVTGPNIRDLMRDEEPLESSLLNTKKIGPEDKPQPQPQPQSQSRKQDQYYYERRQQFEDDIANLLEDIRLGVDKDTEWSKYNIDPGYRIDPAERIQYARGALEPDDTILDVTSAVASGGLAPAGKALRYAAADVAGTAGYYATEGLTDSPGLGLLGALAGGGAAGIAGRKLAPTQAETIGDLFKGMQRPTVKGPGVTRQVAALEGPKVLPELSDELITKSQKKIPHAFGRTSAKELERIGVRPADAVEPPPSPEIKKLFDKLVNDPLLEVTPAEKAYIAENYKYNEIPLFSKEMEAVRKGNLKQAIARGEGAPGFRDLPEDSTLKQDIINPSPSLSTKSIAQLDEISMYQSDDTLRSKLVEYNDIINHGNDPIKKAKYDYVDEGYYERRVRNVQAELERRRLADSTDIQEIEVKFPKGEVSKVSSKAKGVQLNMGPIPTQEQLVQWRNLKNGIRDWLVVKFSKNSPKEFVQGNIRKLVDKLHEAGGTIPEDIEEGLRARGITLGMGFGGAQEQAKHLVEVGGKALRRVAKFLAGIKASGKNLTPEAQIEYMYQNRKAMQAFPLYRPTDIPVAYHPSLGAADPRIVSASIDAILPPAARKAAIEFQNAWTDIVDSMVPHTKKIGLFPNNNTDKGLLKYIMDGDQGKLTPKQIATGDAYKAKMNEIERTLPFERVIALTYKLDKALKKGEGLLKAFEDYAISASREDILRPWIERGKKVAKQYPEGSAQRELADMHIKDRMEGHPDIDMAIARMPGIDIMIALKNWASAVMIGGNISSLGTLGRYSLLNWASSPKRIAGLVKYSQDLATSLKREWNISHPIKSVKEGIKGAVSEAYEYGIAGKKYPKTAGTPSLNPFSRRSYIVPLIETIFKPHEMIRAISAGVAFRAGEAEMMDAIVKWQKKTGHRLHPREVAELKLRRGLDRGGWTQGVDNWIEKAPIWKRPVVAVGGQMMQPQWDQLDLTMRVKLGQQLNAPGWFGKVFGEFTQDAAIKGGIIVLGSIFGFNWTYSMLSSYLPWGSTSLGGEGFNPPAVEVGKRMYSAGSAGVNLLTGSGPQNRSEKYFSSAAGLANLFPMGAQMSRMIKATERYYAGEISTKEFLKQHIDSNTEWQYANRKLAESYQIPDPDQRSNTVDIWKRKRAKAR